LEQAKEAAEIDDLNGLVIMSGTIAANKSISYAPYFKVGLYDKKLNREIVCEYEFAPISDWFKKDLS